MQLLGSAVVSDHYFAMSDTSVYGVAQELLKAMSLTGSLALPTWALFYFIGTCLWAFYRAFPSPALQALSPDAVFPNFIMHQLPPGSFLSVSAPWGMHLALTGCKPVRLKNLPYCLKCL